MDFQSSAWVFTHLQKTLNDLDGDLRGFDFRHDYLQYLIGIQLAQSQYCFMSRARLENMKPELISKLAIQVFLHFKDSQSYVTGSFKNEMERYCAQSLKTLEMYLEYYEGISHYYKSRSLFTKEDGGDMSDALGHSTKASRLLSGLKSDNEIKQEKIQDSINNSEEWRKELIEINNNVYNEKVKPEKDLSPIIPKNYAILRSIEEELNKYSTKEKHDTGINKSQTPDESILPTTEEQKVPMPTPLPVAPSEERESIKTEETDESDMSAYPETKE